MSRPVLAVLGDVRQAFHGLCISTEIQGAPGNAEGGPGRVVAAPKGALESHVTLAGRQVGLPRLRVRDGDGEVRLASFQWAAETDPYPSAVLSIQRTTEPSRVPCFWKSAAASASPARSRRCLSRRDDPW